MPTTTSHCIVEFSQKKKKKKIKSTTYFLLSCDVKKTNLLAKVFFFFGEFSVHVVGSLESHDGWSVPFLLKIILGVRASVCVCV